MTSTDSGRSRSCSPITPTTSSSTATKTGVTPEAARVSRTARASSGSGMPVRARRRALPTTMRASPDRASIPPPGCRCISVASAAWLPGSGAASRIARATGCSDPASATAATRSTPSTVLPQNGTTFVTCRSPRVRVPVLSKTTVSIFEQASRYSPPRIRTPRLAPAPIAASTADGVASRRAQGQATMRSEIDRCRSPVASRTTPAAASITGV